jgi:hypothetical protein
VVAYGVYNKGRYEFAFTSRGSAVVPAEDYVMRLLLTFLKTMEFELRGNPSKVQPDDITFTDISYHTEKQHREANAKKEEVKQSNMDQANQSNTSGNNTSNRFTGR